MKKVALIISIAINVVVLLGVTLQMYKVQQDRNDTDDKVCLNKKNYNMLSIIWIVLMSLLAISVVGQVIYFFTGEHMKRLY